MSLSEPSFSWLELARFWSKVDVPDNPRSADPCWNWRASVVDGYGQIKMRGRVVRAHRIAYEVVQGPIPDDMHVLHSCDNPRCVNPKHLRLGTHEENMQDKKARGRVWYGGPRRKDEAA